MIQFHSNPERTLNITQPFGRTLLLMLPFLALLLGVGEILVRQRQVQSYLKTPSLDSRQRLLDRQWYRLETLVDSGVPIDCIALGNSMVLNGFDPRIFGKNFASQSGKEISCFNFGIDALTPVSASALARILIETYQPKLLIFGIDARDFAIAEDSEETTVILNSSWVKYRLGQFNLEGWLVDHSYLYRYRYALNDLMKILINKYEEPITNQYGFEPFDIEFPVTVPPDPNDSSYHVQYYFKVLGNYSVRPENRTALKQILEMQDTDTTIVLVEMPVPDTYFNFFENPSTDYGQFIDTLRNIATEHATFYLETTRLHIIPDDSWMDYSHVNSKGAMLFSEWLGQQVGNAVVTGKICGYETE